MNILLDVFVIVIIGLSIFTGYRKGIIKSLFSSFGLIGAVICALILTVPVGSLLNNGFVYNNTLDSVQDMLADINNDASGEEIAEQLKANNPKTMALLSNIGFDIDDIVKDYEQKGENAREELAAEIATPTAKVVSNLFAFIICLALSYIGIFILSRVLDLLSKLPVFNITNKTLGVIFGVVIGLFRVSIYSLVVSGLYPLVIGLFTNNSEIINAVSNTVFLNFFAQNNLFVFLVSKVF